MICIGMEETRPGLHNRTVVDRASGSENLGSQYEESMSPIAGLQMLVGWPCISTTRQPQAVTLCGAPGRLEDQRTVLRISLQSL